MPRSTEARPDVNPGDLGAGSTELAAPRPVTPVGILAETLHRIVDGWDGTAAPHLLDELKQAAELACGLDPYVSACTTPESPALRELARRTREHDWSRDGAASGVMVEQEMLSGHVEGQMLKMLVHLTRATRVLDIGMFSGYSALAMAEALPADGEVVACELDPDVAAFAQDCLRESPVGGRITIEVGPAASTLRRLAETGASFDLVFLDADKPGYQGYLGLLLGTGLLAEHGTVCVDNTLLQGEPYTSGPSTPNGEAIARFNAAVAGDPGVEQVLVPLRDGLTLIRRAPAPPEVRS